MSSNCKEVCLFCKNLVKYLYYALTVSFQYNIYVTMIFWCTISTMNVLCFHVAMKLKLILSVLSYVWFEIGWYICIINKCIMWYITALRRDFSRLGPKMVWECNNIITKFSITFLSLPICWATVFTMLSLLTILISYILSLYHQLPLQLCVSYYSQYCGKLTILQQYRHHMVKILPTYGDILSTILSTFTIRISYLLEYVVTILKMLHNMISNMINICNFSPSRVIK